MKSLLLIAFAIKLLAPSFANDYLLQEMESLRSSLDHEDSARGELTLRLADLYFDESIKEDSGENTVTKRKRALELYQEALNGEHGVAKAQGLLRIKVEFQVARLNEKLGEKEKAAAILKTIFENSQTPQNFKREAAFHLANYFEEKPDLVQADKFYLESIKLCSSVDTCNMAHYRRAWLLYKETKLEEGIAELKLSLFDSKGQVREQVIQDYVLFLSQKTTSGVDELKEIEALEKKTKQTGVVAKLAEAFFVAGNRVAGSYCLSYLEKKNPSRVAQTRLLEESYGFRKLDELGTYLSRLENNSTPTPSKEENEEINKILKRLIVQLDAEAERTSEYKPILKRSIDVFLSFFPKDEMSRKMQEGWLKVEDNNQKKIDRLAVWIKQAQAQGESNSEIRKLRQTRLSLAQTEKQSAVVIEESLAITKILDGKDESREFEYVAAREMYEQKKYETALPHFVHLTDDALKSGNIDQWAVMSQNLVLDIYNSQKMFSKIPEQVSKWNENEFVKKRADLSQESKVMGQIAIEANFEVATKDKNESKSLETFYNYCLQNILPEKSCENAKVLAVKLKDQAKLVGILEKLDDKNALLSEYELMGSFAKAAALGEKLLPLRKSEIANYLKVALLYELDRDFKSRNRVLQSLIIHLKTLKTIEPKFEEVIYVTLDEANLLDYSSILIPWSMPTKVRLMSNLDLKKPSKQSKEFLLSQKDYAGDAWSRAVLEKVQALDQDQRKISFYGSQSRTQFQKRTKAIEKMLTAAKDYLDGADIDTRVYLLHLVTKAYQDFSNEIMNTPIPEGLDQATLDQAKAGLQEMASAYEANAHDYQRLFDEQMGKVNAKSVEQVKTNLAKTEPNYASFIITAESSTVLPENFDYQKISDLSGKLEKDSANKKVLSDFEAFYRSHKSERIASYFRGRMNSLNQ